MAYKDKEKAKAWYKANYNRYYEKYKERKLAQQKARRAANPGARKKYLRKQTLAQYDLTPADYEAMLGSQHGVCAICFKPGSPNLHVDHCHETGKVRGLLCGACNRGIGLLGDSPERLLSAASYLERSRVV